MCLQSSAQLLGVHSSHSIPLVPYRTVTLPATLLSTAGLTSVSLDSVRNPDVGTKLPHLLDHMSNLQGQLVGWSQAEALREVRELSDKSHIF